MMYKPRGYVTTMNTDSDITVGALLAKKQIDAHPVGRLDKDTEGLLLFTDDGNLDRFLLRPEHHVKKTYLFACFGHISLEQAMELSKGVVLSGSHYKTGPAECTVLEYSTIGACEPLLPHDRKNHYLKNPGRPVTIGKLVIAEGHKHQVRLMVKAVGSHVFWLKRIAIGELLLNEDMSPGDLLPLSNVETAVLGYNPDSMKTFRRFEIFEVLPEDSMGQIPGAVFFSNVNKWAIPVGTFFYGEMLTYLPHRLPDGFSSLLPACFHCTMLNTESIPEIQQRIREGDRNRSLYNIIINLPGDICLLRRDGRVKAIIPDTLSSFQKRQLRRNNFEVESRRDEIASAHGYL